MNLSKEWRKCEQYFWKYIFNTDYFAAEAKNKLQFYIDRKNFTKLYVTLLKTETAVFAQIQA